MYNKINTGEVKKKMISIFGVVGIIGLALFVINLGLGLIILYFKNSMELDSMELALTNAFVGIFFTLMAIGLLLTIIGVIIKAIKRKKEMSTNYNPNKVIDDHFEYSIYLKTNKWSEPYGYITIKDLANPNDPKRKDIIISVIQRAFQLGFTEIVSIGENCKSFTFKRVDKIADVIAQKSLVNEIDLLEQYGSHKEEVKKLKAELPIPYKKWENAIIFEDKVVDESEVTQYLDNYKDKVKESYTSHFGKTKVYDKNGNYIKTLNEGETYIEKEKVYNDTTKETYHRKTTVTIFLYKKSKEPVMATDGTIASMILKESKLVSSSTIKK